MGQRHQIYLKTPYQFNQENGIDDESKQKVFAKNNIVALHHQWLYGTLPLQQLSQFIKFYNKGIEDQYFVFGNKGDLSGNPEEALKNLYSLNFENGIYTSSVYIEDYDLATNPLMGDNNDGITIIDVSKPEEPRYCFMFLHPENDSTGPKPLSAEEYVRTYYNENEYKENQHWQGRDQEIERMESLIQKLVTTFQAEKNFKLLSQSEVETIFPTLYKSQETT